MWGWCRHGITPALVEMVHHLCWRRFVAQVMCLSCLHLCLIGLGPSSPIPSFAIKNSTKQIFCNVVLQFLDNSGSSGPSDFSNFNWSIRFKTSSLLTSNWGGGRKPSLELGQHS